MLVLTEIFFKSSSNDKDSSRIISKCFWEEVLLTWLLVYGPENVIFTDQWTLATPNSYIRMCKDIKPTLGKNNCDEFGQVKLIKEYSYQIKKL